MHLVNVSADALPDGWTATGPDDADIAIVRLSAPFEHRDHYFLESGMQQGSLEFAADDIDAVVALSRKVPVVLTVTLNRPAILTPFLDAAAAIVGEFGVSDAVLLRVLTGDLGLTGTFRSNFPRDMGAVQQSAPDTPNDTENPLFPAGWGLTLTSERDLSEMTTAERLTARAEYRQDSPWMPTPQPRLSWIFETEQAGWRQLRAEIRTDDGHAATIDGEKNSFVEWPFTPLEPREPVTAEVRLQSVDDQMDGLECSRRPPSRVPSRGRMDSEFRGPSVTERGGTTVCASPHD